MGNAHSPVIDGNGQLICIQAIGTPDDEITTNTGQIIRKSPIAAIRKRDRNVRDVDAPGWLPVHMTALFFRHAITMPIIYKMLPFKGRSYGLQSGTAAITGVQQMFFLQLLHGFFI